MAKDVRAPEKEGWNVPFGRFAIAMVTTPIVLLLAVVGTSVVYDRELRSPAFVAPTPFPAPGLDAGMRRAPGDETAPPPPPRPSRAMAAAEAEIVRNGLDGWPAGTRR